MSTIRFKTEFGARVRERRLALGMSQETLADMVGYKHKTSISKIESGVADCSQTMMLQLAEALRTTPGYLVDGDEASIKPATQTDSGLHGTDYDLLTEKNKAIVDSLIETLLASQSDA